MSLDPPIAAPHEQHSPHRDTAGQLTLGLRVLVHPNWGMALSRHWDLIILNRWPSTDSEKDWIATEVRTRLVPGGVVMVGDVLQP